MVAQSVQNHSRQSYGSRLSKDDTMCLLKGSSDVYVAGPASWQQKYPDQPFFDERGHYLIEQRHQHSKEFMRKQVACATNQENHQMSCKTSETQQQLQEPVPVDSKNVDPYEQIGEVVDSYEGEGTGLFGDGKDCDKLFDWRAQIYLNGGIDDSGFGFPRQNLDIHVSLGRL